MWKTPQEIAEEMDDEFSGLMGDDPLPDQDFFSDHYIWLFGSVRLAKSHDEAQDILHEYLKRYSTEYHIPMRALDAHLDTNPGRYGYEFKLYTPSPVTDDFEELGWGNKVEIMRSETEIWQ